MFDTAILTIRNLSAVFPDNNGGLRALEDVSFDVHPQEFVCVLGPSGSGKTTLLRILAGLIAPTSGSFMFGHGEQPSIGMVFQHANLMPWRTVMDNIKLPLEVINIGEQTARMKTQEMIDLVGLQGFEDHFPHELSGGMQQRCNLARALTVDPKILIMDEPFAALDAQTREIMQSELLRIWNEGRKTVLFVSLGLPPETRMPASQLKSAPPSSPVEIGPCRAGTRPSCTNQPAIKPAKKATIPAQLMSP